jgi:insulin-like growth factor 1 receptor
LQDLWTWKDKREQLLIRKGRIFVHINPKLCYDKILQMKEYVNMPDMPHQWDYHDVSPHSNGDKAACKVSKLNVNISDIESEKVYIKLDNFKKQMRDERSLLGYLIYYRES